MDLGNQARIKALVEEFGQDTIAVILGVADAEAAKLIGLTVTVGDPSYAGSLAGVQLGLPVAHILEDEVRLQIDRKSTRLNSSHVKISYAVFCLKKKKKKKI